MQDVCLHMFCASPVLQIFPCFRWDAAKTVLPTAPNRWGIRGKVDTKVDEETDKYSVRPCPFRGYRCCLSRRPLSRWKSDLLPQPDASISSLETCSRGLALALDLNGL
jgi:hypothetical protein